MGSLRQGAGELAREYPASGAASQDKFGAIPFPAAASAARSGGTGTWVIGVYIICGYLSDFLMQLVGLRPFLSTIAGIAVLLLFAVSGRVGRALETKAGKLWLFMMVWLIVDIPFSYWPGGSKDLLVQYIPKIHMVLFFICAAALTVRDCGTLLFTNAIGGFVLLVECMVFGAGDASGRFCIPSSMFLSNPNDVGIQLVVMMGAFAFLLLGKGMLSRISGLAGLMLGFYYLLKTGSRGSLLACGMMGLFCVLFTRYRTKVMLLAIPLCVILLSMPGDTLHRMTLILLNPVQADAGASRQDQSSIESQIERQELLMASIDYMFTHPLFGIGPGQFSDYRWSQSKMAGIHVASLGTHNAYTQVGSECGIPVFLCFAGVVFLSIRSNYRIYRRVQANPELQPIARVSFCLLLSCIGYGVNAVFHHSAYSLLLATMGGTSAALYLAVKPMLYPAMPAAPAQRW